MKLSELVGYLNFLDSLSVEPTASKCLGDLNSLKHFVNSREPRFLDIEEDLDRFSFVVQNALSNFDQSLKELRANVYDMILSQEKKMFKQSNALYQEMEGELPDYIIQRKKTFSPQSQEFIRDRLRLYANWQFPGMIVRPETEDYIKDLVALDPLYIVDTHQDLLTPALTYFPDVYVNRLRQYVVNEYAKKGVFFNLPHGQFGLVFVNNYFQYKSINVLERYFKEILDLLRPGGVLAFTYNNCDLEGAVRLVEHNFHTYTPGRLVKNILDSLGFELILEKNLPDGCHWLEVRKPGTASSLRGGQTLARIATIDINRPKIQKTLDIPEPKVYTLEAIEKLRWSAVLLGIDSEDMIFTAYSPEKIESMVEKQLSQSGVDRNIFEEKLLRLINRKGKKT